MASFREYGRGLHATKGRKQWLDGDGSNQVKPKAFVGTRDAKD